MRKIGNAIRVVITGALTIAGPFCYSQTIPEKFTQYRSEAAQEKIYIQTDREAYVTGETLQVSAYVVDGSLHRPSGLSKVAYVELLDANNSPVVQAKISLKEGRGGGSLFLPASLSSGNFVLRAYTRWMKNFDSDYFFHKKVTIVNTFVKLDRAPEKKPELDIQFFPEGGNWISGVELKVGFKVADASGHGVGFRGSLINESNDTVLHFSPHKFGMGSFNFRPEAGRKVRAIIAAHGQRRVVDLPSSSLTGYTLSLASDGTHIRLVAQASGAAANSTIFLFAHARQVIIKAEEKLLNDGKTTFDFTLAQLPEGITHFTLFDSSQRPVCERIFFKAPSSKLEISATTQSQQYGTRKEIVLDLTSSLSCNTSVSVFRLDSVSNLSSGRILEYLWLSSDLRGVIESPEFYFSDTDEARAAAENLMLTQGWRKFKWSDVLSGSPTFRYVPEHHGHIIEGLVRNNAGDTAATVLTLLSSPDRIINVYASRSDKKGGVIYDVRNLYGPRKIVVYSETPSRVELLNPFSTSISSFKLDPFDISPATARDLLQRSVAMQVQDIYYDDAPLPVFFDSLSFYGKADETYVLDDYTRFPVMEEVLREYVPGVMVRKNRDGFRFQMPNVLTRKLIEDPMVLLDGVPVPDVDKIMAFDPMKVIKLEVVRRTFYNGLASFPGIVSFTTYDGDLGGFTLDEHYVTLDYDGLNLQRDFYRPNYEKQAYENLPDPRSLLYWNSSLSLQQGVSTKLRFYSSDVPGNYVVVIDGLTPHGKAGSTTYQLAVKP
jgi:hypothetical protein